MSKSKTLPVLYSSYSKVQSSVGNIHIHLHVYSTAIEITQPIWDAMPLEQSASTMNDVDVYYIYLYIFMWVSNHNNENIHVHVHVHDRTLGDFHYQHLGLCDMWLFAARELWFID